MLSDNIKKEMKNKNILAKDLAHTIGITPTYLSYILNNKRKNPSIELLNKIATALDTTLDSLLIDTAKSINVNNRNINNPDFKQLVDLSHDRLQETIQNDKLKTDFTINEIKYIEDLRKLNDAGIEKAINYTKDLTEMPKYQKNDNITTLPKKEIWEEEGKEHLMPIASHDDGLTEEQKNIMNEKIAEFLKTLK